MQYIARVSNRRGRALYEGAPQATRELAAVAVFRARPGARSCSTCQAHLGRSTGMDIRWHRRDDIMLCTQSSECPDPGELAEDRWNETHGDRF
jgi:hypothetical protein